MCIVFFFFKIIIFFFLFIPHAGPLRSRCRCRGLSVRGVFFFFLLFEYILNDCARHAYVLRIYTIITHTHKQKIHNSSSRFSTRAKLVGILFTLPPLTLLVCPNLHNFFYKYISISILHVLNIHIHTHTYV